MTTPADILAFWFGDRASAERETYRDAWFVKSAEFDAEIARRFGADVEIALRGGFTKWETGVDGTLALILLLDQFNRNLNRGTARAFAGDECALALAKTALANGFDQRVPLVERQFFYMPFEHSEDLNDQDRCCALMKTLSDPKLDDYAERHRAIIKRFGRFPHRNAALGRASTPEEIAFLKAPGSSF